MHKQSHIWQLRPRKVSPSMIWHCLLWMEGCSNQCLYNTPLMKRRISLSEMWKNINSDYLNTWWNPKGESVNWGVFAPFLGWLPQHLCCTLPFPSPNHIDPHLRRFKWGLTILQIGLVDEFLMSNWTLKSSTAHLVKTGARLCGEGNDINIW